MPALRGSWKDISSQHYADLFGVFGGSFSVHPRAVDLVSRISGIPVRYVALEQAGEPVAALPLWGQHVVGTPAALEFRGAHPLMDFGEPEVVLPIAPGARIRMPFIADMLSDLHENMIERLGPERRSSLTLAKGIAASPQRFSGRNVKNLRRKLRHLVDAGARFEPVTSFSPREIVEIFSRLHSHRWGSPPPAAATLPIVITELHDMLGGDVMLIGDRPVAFELTYKHDTPRWLFANGVQAGWDLEFSEHSPGSLLLFHNLQKYETEATASGKPLRYSFGWNNQNYKKLWTYEVQGYRVGTARSYLAKMRTLWWLRKPVARPCMSVVAAEG